MQYLKERIGRFEYALTVWTVLTTVFLCLPVYLYLLFSQDRILFWLRLPILLIISGCIILLVLQSVKRAHDCGWQGNICWLFLLPVPILILNNEYIVGDYLNILIVILTPPVLLTTLIPVLILILYPASNAINKYGCPVRFISLQPIDRGRYLWTSFQTFILAVETTFIAYALLVPSRKTWWTNDYYYETAQFEIMFPFTLFLIAILFEATFIFYSVKRLYGLGYCDKDVAKYCLRLAIPGVNIPVLFTLFFRNSIKA